MIREIEARTLLSTCKNPENWFGVRYNMNIYRGCEHQCIYCDSRSECYRIENFSDVLVKVNAVELLQKELAAKRVKGIIGTGAMSDPYTPAEKALNMTGKALNVIAQYAYPIHIITKSSLILKDLDTLKEINRVHASVAFTVTTADDGLARKLEPGAPSPSERFRAMKALSESGIYTGVTMMPVLPFIEDNEKNVEEIIGKAHESGAEFIIPWFGMSLRDRQRSYYFSRLDKLFPGVRDRYEKEYGSAYACTAKNADRLKYVFKELCSKYGMVSSMGKLKTYPRHGPMEQISMF